MSPQYTDITVSSKDDHEACLNMADGQNTDPNPNHFVGIVHVTVVHRVSPWTGVSVLFITLTMFSMISLHDQRLMYFMRNDKINLE